MCLSASDFGRFATFLGEYLGINSVWDIFRIVFDILIISYVFYLLLTLLRDSRAFQLIKSVILILFVAFLAELLQLSTLSFVLKLVIEVLPVMLIVLFHPELRRILEGLGQTSFMEMFKSGTQKTADLSFMVSEIVKATYAMADEKTGALIIFERKTNLSEVIRTGTIVDSAVTAQFLRQLFIKNTPLHDGAVIIKKNRIAAAACYLPLSANLQLNKDLGTRHRAGIGISENTDCISIIVSEETGYVSVAENGQLKRNVKEDALRSFLIESLAPKTENDKATGKRANIFRRGGKQK
ncbi:MAG: diadenylate cyclase CdaA [Clostridia bacterium]|nr:diadenylate cyclase CdaA [Clostridia bacterium]